MKDSTNILFTGRTEYALILVKIARRYGKDVRLWCAEKGFGPKLLGFEELSGEWLMVVMELLDNSWISLTDLHPRPEGLKDRIGAATTSLHHHGMVHGDLRDTNVMGKNSC